MDPLTGAILGTVLSTTFSVIGNAAKQNAANYQEEQVMAAARENQRRALYAGQVQASQIRTKEHLLEGTNIVQTAGSGISLSGSALDVIGQNISMYEKDANMALYNATMQGNDYMRSAYNQVAVLEGQKGTSTLNMLAQITGSIFQGYNMYETNTMAQNVQNTRLNNSWYAMVNDMQTKIDMYKGFYGGNFNNNINTDFGNLNTVFKPVDNSLTSYYNNDSFFGGAQSAMDYFKM